MQDCQLLVRRPAFPALGRCTLWLCLISTHTQQQQHCVSWCLHCFTLTAASASCW